MGGRSRIDVSVAIRDGRTAKRRARVAVVVALALAPVTAARAEETPLEIAVVGLVHDHVHGLFRQVKAREDVRIVGVAEPNAALSDKYSQKYGLDRSLFFANLEDLLNATNAQALVVHTSIRDHLPVVRIAAKRKLPVMVEKPLAVSLADARAIERIARQAGIDVLVNYETTWYASNAAAYDLAGGAALGDIRKIVVRDGHKGPKEIGVSQEFLSWLTDPVQNGAGALFDFGCYGANLATWLMKGQRPLAVTAVTQRIKPDVYPRVDDEATIILTYPRAQAIVQASWNWPYSRKDLDVYGTRGAVFADAPDRLRTRLEGRAETSSTPPALVGAAADSLSYLRAVVSGSLRPDGLSSLDNNMVVMEILDAARRSAATGKTVRLVGQPR